MKTQISLSEIDSLIRKSIQDKNLHGHISDDQIAEIKNKIKAKLSMPSTGAMFYASPAVDTDGNGDFDMSGGLEEVITPEEDEVITAQKTDSPISHETTIDNDALNVSRKEGELETKEQIINHEAQELENKAEELENKEQELSYKPTLPNSLLQAEPGKLFIYDMTQLSLGGESLSNQPYNNMDNPESKSSMHDLWIQDGKVRAHLYKVEYKPIGEMVFDPFNGTTKFVEMPQPLESDLPKEERDGVQQAIDSQKPIEPMIDSTDPVTDVTLPMSADMGLQGPNVQQAIESTVEKILRQYFSNAK